MKLIDRDVLSHSEVTKTSDQDSVSKCMYSMDDFTDEDRKALCDGCEEDCEYNKKGNPVSDDFKLFEKEYLEKEEDEILCVYDRHAGLVDGAQWQKLQMIEKACKWLDENAAKYLIDKSVHGVKMTGLDTSFTEDFKKAMKA